MKTFRLRTGPPMPAVAVAVLLSLVPALYLAIVVSGKEAFSSFLEGPVWVILATVPLWLLRRESVVDRASQRLRVGWGFWIPGLVVVPLFWRRHSIQGSTSVGLRREIRGSKKSRDEFYVTRLLPGEAIVTERLDYRSARRDAERTAEALDLPMADSVDHADPVIRPAKSLSKSLRQRLRDGELPSPEPRRPGWSDLDRRDQGGVLTIERPAVRIFTTVLSVTLFHAVVNGILWVEHSLGGPAGSETSIAFYAIASILGLMSTAAFLMTLEEATVRWKVELSDERLRLHRRSWVLRSRREMRLSDLEEMAVEQCIRLRSDRRQIAFAEDLDPEEREWVGHELLRRMRGS